LTLGTVSPMLYPMPKQLPTADRRHWSRVQAAVIGQFKWPSKSKSRPEFVVKLASEIADLATVEYAKRTRKQP